MKKVVWCVSAFVLFTVNNFGLAQDQNSPERVVRLLQQYINFETTRYLPTLYADTKSEGPLPSSRYSALIEKMRASWSKLENRTIAIDNVEEMGPSTVTVSATIHGSGERVKFYTRSFKGLWYIDGIEFTGAN